MKEGYNLRGACLIALQKLPVKTEATQGEKSPQKEQKGEDKSQKVQQVEENIPPKQEEDLAGSEGETEGNVEEQSDFESEGILEGHEEVLKEDEAKKDYWKPQLQPYTLELKEKKYSVFVEDEGGKLNVNALVDKKKDIFKRLLEVRGVSQQEAEIITDCLLDWLDKDDVPQPRGAESKYYESLPEPYSCRNGPLNYLEELTLIKGVSPEIYGKVEKDLTIYGKELKININSASREVIHAVLGIGLQEADEVVALVKEKNGITNLDELKDLFFKFGVAGKDFDDIRAAMNVNYSPYLSIRSVGSTGRQYTLVVDKSNESILAVYPE
ncbi:MAG TPA: general secretion pathway protein GspK [Candidatus Hypogeohydataceae bacterium YC41]